MCEAIYRIAREKLQDEFVEIEARGETRGETRGKEIGKAEAFISLVRDGLLSASEAAKRLSISEEEFMEKMATM